MTVNSRRCYVRSEGPVLAVSEVDDLIVIATDDALLVTPKSGDQDVKLVVDRLKSNGHAGATQSVRCHRPWVSTSPSTGVSAFRSNASL